MLYNRMLEERNRLDTVIASLNQQIATLPPGNLFFTHNGKYLKWYQSKGHEQIYIPKKERKLAEQLAQKKYLSTLLKELIQERDAINLYLNHHKLPDNRSEQLLCKDSVYHDFLHPYYTSLSEELSNWVQTPYEHNKLYPEQLNQPTISGHNVRSKSEALIDTILYKNQIPFRYEAALSVGDSIFYPDFTIRHPHTGEIYYWEHFGMMDIPDYSKKAFSKLQRYSCFGIISGIQLITTYETKDAPLSPELVENLVTYYFK